MGIFRRTRLQTSTARADGGLPARSAREPFAVTSSRGGASSLDDMPVLEPPHDQSDVFACKPSEGDTPLPVSSSGEAAEPVAKANAVVTLFVFGWHQVEPGPLSWAFPSLMTALTAVRTMKNAAQWCIVSGNDWSSMDAARTHGAVLIEQLV